LVGSIKEAEAKLEPYSLAYRQAAAKLRGQLHRDPTDDEVAREVESGDIKESLDKRDLLVRSLRVNLSALARWNWISDSVIFRDLSLRVCPGSFRCPA